MGTRLKEILVAFPTSIKSVPLLDMKCHNLPFEGIRSMNKEELLKEFFLEIMP